MVTKRPTIQVFDRTVCWTNPLDGIIGGGGWISGVGQATNQGLSHKAITTCQVLSAYHWRSRPKYPWNSDNHSRTVMSACRESHVSDGNLNVGKQCGEWEPMSWMAIGLQSTTGQMHLIGWHMAMLTPFLLCCWRIHSYSSITTRLCNVPTLPKLLDT